MTDPNPFSNSLHLPDQMIIAARLESHALADVAAETTAQLNAAFATVDWARRRVAVAVGSRGIDQLPTVVRATIDYLRARGASPFIIPAMGSHGGATAEGQTEMLGTLGVTAESAGAEIVASMEIIELGQVASGTRAFVARAAYEADAVLLINRIKPHTDFVSTELGSGLRKMSVIGLGKVAGAAECHRAVLRHSYESVLLEVSACVLSTLPAVYGLALVEDAHHRLAHIEALTGAQIAAREPALLAQARAWMPALPFDRIDVLIVDEIGKNISGSGMDPNIIERRLEGLPGRRREVRSIYARSLTPESHGNAIGLGLADVVSARLVAAMDRHSTFINALSALAPESVRTPIHFATDAACLDAALRLADVEPAQARIVRMRNTLALDRFIVSANYAAQIKERDDLSIVQPPRAWRFTAEGNFDPADDALLNSQ